MLKIDTKSERLRQAKIINIQEVIKFLPTCI